MKTALLFALASLVLPLPAQDSSDAPREQGAPSRERIARAKAEMGERLKAELAEADELEKAGKKEEAEVRRQRIKAWSSEAREKLERAARVADGERRDGDHRREGEPRPEGGDRRPDAPPRAELERKLRHVEQAMGHLREAGMPDAAEHLNQIANRLRAGLRGEDEQRRENARREESHRPQGDIEALRREIQELRQAVRELSERQTR